DERRGVAFPAATEPVVVADDERADAVAGDKQTLNEVTSPQRGERRRERQHDDVLDAAVDQPLALFTVGGDVRWRGRRLDYLDRVGTEGDDEAGQPLARAALDEPAENVAVAAMDAVEGADSDDRAPTQPGQSRRVRHRAARGRG